MRAIITWPALSIQRRPNGTKGSGDFGYKVIKHICQRLAKLTGQINPYVLYIHPIFLKPWLLIGCHLQEEGLNSKLMGLCTSIKLTVCVT